jgi:hypothetical protein
MQRIIVAVTLSIALLIPQTGLAFTAQEALLIEHLRTYAREERDFQPLLGEELFEGKTTGLRDSSPEVRGRAAEIIADYGSSAQLEELTQALSRERDNHCRQMIEISLQRLQAKQDNAFAAQLWNEAHRSGDLEVVLGNAPFSDRSQTGLRDANPYIRQIAAEIILDLGNKDQLEALHRATQLERNPSTRDRLYLTYVKAGLKFSDNPEYFLAGFLADCRQAVVTGDSVPEEALEYALNQAGMSGMQGLKSQIAGLRAALQEEKMRRLAQETETTLDTAGQYSEGQPVSEDIYTSPNLNIQQYAFNRLLASDSAETQQEANRMIINLLVQKNRGAFILEELIRDKGVLSSENENACLEFGADQPEGWQISLADRAKLVYPGEDARSYQRAIEIENYSSQTKIVSNQVDFAGKLPKAVEFGLSYKVIPFVEEDLQTSSANDAEKKSVVLKLRGVLADGTSVENEIRQDYFFPSGWEGLSGSFSAPLPENPLRQVQIEVVITGRVRLALDDIYARRAEDEFDHESPLVYGIDLLSDVVLIKDIKINGKKKTVVEPVKLEAQVEVPKEGGISYHWYSDQVGDLGEGLKKKIRLTSEGKHQITFIAIDKYGFTSEEYAQVDVVRPRPVLSWEQTKEKDRIYLKLSLGKLEKWKDEFEIKAYLYANKKPVAVCKSFPCRFKVDARYLPVGAVDFEAKVYLKHYEAKDEFIGKGKVLPYRSNLLNLQR